MRRKEKTMKVLKRILMFVFALVLVFSVIAVGGTAADDIQDFIGRAERQELEAQRQIAQHPTELSVPITVHNSQSHDSTANSSHIAGDRLETRFDLAPALHGGSGTSGLQVGQISTAAAATEQANQTESAAAEIDPISLHIPPPNTGHDAYLIWVTLSVAALLGGTLASRKRRFRRLPARQA